MTIKLFKKILIFFFCYQTKIKRWNVCVFFFCLFTMISTSFNNLTTASALIMMFVANDDCAFSKTNKISEIALIMSSNASLVIEEDWFECDYVRIWDWLNMILMLHVFSNQRFFFVNVSIKQLFLAPKKK